MVKVKEDTEKVNAGTGLGWFWVGAGIGLLLSATTVLVVSEFREGRHQRRLGQLAGYEQGESDLAVDIASAFSGGLSALAGTAEILGLTFNAARSELIKFNLDSSGAGTGSGASAWYTDDEDEVLPGYNGHQGDKA